MAIGLILATSLLMLGLGAGYKQVVVLRRAHDEPFMAGGDRTYYRKQARRRLVISGLLLILSGMIVIYYVSGMDARMDAIPERNKGGEPPPPDDPQAKSDREFTLLATIYLIALILVLGLFAWLAVLDVWATRKYWMVRYREIKTEHEAKLRRDLAVYRQQKLNERMPGLKKPDNGPEKEELNG